MSKCVPLLWCGCVDGQPLLYQSEFNCCGNAGVASCATTLSGYPWASGTGLNRLNYSNGQGNGRGNGRYDECDDILNGKGPNGRWGDKNNGRNDGWNDNGDNSRRNTGKNGGRNTGRNRRGNGDNSG